MPSSPPGHPGPEPSAPSPAPGSSAAPAPPPCIIALDVADLGRSVAFYAAALGFSVHTAHRAGQLMESRLLASPRFPGVGLHLRAALGKRVGGSQPGSLLRISLHTPDLDAHLPSLKALGVRWVHPPLEPAPPDVSFVDPDSYLIELFRATPGPLLQTGGTPRAPRPPHAPNATGP